MPSSLSFGGTPCRLLLPLPVLQRVSDETFVLKTLSSIALLASRTESAFFFVVGNAQLGFVFILTSVLCAYQKQTLRATK